MDMISSKTNLFSVWLKTALVVLASFQMAYAQKSTTDSLELYKSAIYYPDKDIDLAVAITHLRNEAEKTLMRGDTLKAVEIMQTLITGEMEVGSVYESEETAIKAIRLLDQIESNKSTDLLRNVIYRELGRVYRLLKNPNNSLLFYHNALALSENTLDSLKVINNMGNVYLDSEQYAEAEVYFRQTYEMALRLGDSLVMARVIDNLGHAQAMNGSPDALDNMNKALEIRLNHNDLVGTYSSYRHLTTYYRNNQLLQEAKEHAEKAYEIAKEINSPTYIEDALTNLLKAEDDPRAVEFIHLKDSLEQARYSIRNKYAALQYNTAKSREQAQTEKYLREKAIRKSRNIQFLMVLIILISVGIFFILRIRHKRKTFQEVFETESRISKRVHDEVANDVYRLMTKVQYNHGDNDELLDDLESIYKRTRDISRDSAALIIEKDFGKQINDLLQSYQDGEITITTQNISSINWRLFSEIKKQTIYRVLQELMTNMRKYSQAKLVVLIFNQNGRNLQIKYSDNGIGSEIKTKNGLRNAENRIKAIKGSFTFDSIPNKGFRATINL